MYENSLTFLLIFSNTLLVSSGQTVTLYKESFQSNDTQVQVEVDLQNCTDTLPQQFVEGEIQCGNFTTECAQFYDHPACSGNSIEIRKESLNNKWNLKDIKSVGPCNPKSERLGCKMPNYNLDYGLEPVVELFSKENFKGRMSLIRLRHSSCHEIHPKLKDSVASIRTKNVFNICLQMYSETNCSQDEVTFQGHRRFFQTVEGNVTGLASLRNWGFQGKARSISLCKFGCKETEQNVSVARVASTNKKPRFNYVTIFDERNSSGNALHISSKEKCLNLAGPWEGAAKSLVLHQECVILYNTFDCGDNNSIFVKLFSSPKQQRIIKKPKNRGEGDDAVVCSSNCNLLEWQMEGKLRSLGRCIKSESRPQPLIAIFVLAGFFLSGILIASCVNRIVRSRDKKENEMKVYGEQPMS